VLVVWLTSLIDPIIFRSPENLMSFTIVDGMNALHTIFVSLGVEIMEIFALDGSLLILFILNANGWIICV
tara:strand:- start:2348 stop:2557 length:210 start_codon:yes stop_codon:yes gene_type:complete